jgi:hypothetical protein
VNDRTHVFPLPPPPLRIEHSQSSYGRRSPSDRYLSHYANQPASTLSEIPTHGHLPPVSINRSSSMYLPSSYGHGQSKLPTARESYYPSPSNPTASQRPDPPGSHNSFSAPRVFIQPHPTFQQAIICLPCEKPSSRSLPYGPIPSMQPPNPQHLWRSASDGGMLNRFNIQSGL